jgi:hypothetical protein
MTSGKFDVAAAGHKLLFDGASFMDSHAAGDTASRALGDELRACRPSVFVLPKGAPFTLTTFYRVPRGRELLFDDAFRATFPPIITWWNRASATTFIAVFLKSVRRAQARFAAGESGRLNRRLRGRQPHLTVLNLRARLRAP